MTREQAIAFIQALNLSQPYVPRVIFVGIVNNPLMRSLEALSGGLVEFEAKLVPSKTGEMDAKRTTP